MTTQRLWRTPCHWTWWPSRTTNLLLSQLSAMEGLVCPTPSWGRAAPLLAHTPCSAPCHGVVSPFWCRCFFAVGCLQEPACLGRLRTLLWSVLAVLVVPVGALTAGAGQRVGGLRRRLVAGWTGRKVPASPAEAGSAAAGRDDRFFGLRRQNGRRKAGPGRQDAGQADGTAVVPVRLHAGEK